MITRILCAALLILTLQLGAFAQEQDTVVIITHDSFAMSEAILAGFEAESGLTVQILRAGDAGQMLSQAILSKNNPLGDLLYGVDNTFLSRALAAEIFTPYESPLLPLLRPELLPEADFMVTPVDFGDVCLNYDIAWFEDAGLSPPDSFAALADEAYRGLLALQNPATSSPGLAFLLATIAEFGDEGEYTWLDYWAELRENDALVAEGWTDAYYGHFTVGSRGLGDRPLVVSYASSPPAEVLFSEDPEAGAVTAAITADGMCFRQVEYVGVLAGAANEAGARQFLDFMLGQAFQEELPTNMFVFPAREDSALHPIFAEYAQVPALPASIEPALIEQNREAWIQAWVEVMLS